ncbi:hypothetical protein K227x_55390 [Rubripirellula lacrimiformis]|uniref:Competence protein A n=1 Tax=Rubripirellula lacrimiformis TaxID=1930273 RepID=A0A517NJ10_9BACT|nr:hypothetical protein [Rubripirellula lacrimiformis]QDT07114.1 hypothetical protein K227x_55390 [Rubripirellula lacrimiformis]
MPATNRKANSRAQHPSDVAARQCFGLRIESHQMQVAIATPTQDERFHIQIDNLECDAPDGWLSAAGYPLLVEALEGLVERHNMRRMPIAVSLDGDFCVTRVTIGTAAEVDHELSRQATRIPRYLQLGPGEKVTGGARRKIDSTTDYAVTGVVNRSLIQLVYDAFRSADIEVMWVEPSLVGVARLVGQAGLWGDQPIMIADGTGKQWDVGIASAGRLLLDYRPANATSEEGLREALDGHISRLKRFCHRHLRGISGDVEELLICGDGDKPSRAIEALRNVRGLSASILSVPELPHLYTIAEQDRAPHCVPAVATVFPLLIDVTADEVPDLLVQVRRAPDLSWPQQMVKLLWPVAAATLLVAGSYAMVSKERNRHANTSQSRESLESEIVASNVKFSRLARKREQLNHFRTIARQTQEPNWAMMLRNITHCLPDSAKLNEFRVESDGHVLMSGVVMDESVVYELVNTLRRLPLVTQVALNGTTPEHDSQATRFSIRLATVRSATPETMGDGNEA